MLGAPDDYMEYRKGMFFEFSEGENITCPYYIALNLISEWTSRARSQGLICQMLRFKSHIVPSHGFSVFPRF